MPDNDQLVLWVTWQKAKLVYLVPTWKKILQKSIFYKTYHIPTKYEIYRTNIPKPFCYALEVMRQKGNHVVMVAPSVGKQCACQEGWDHPTGTICLLSNIRVQGALSLSLHIYVCIQLFSEKCYKGFP